MNKYWKDRGVPWEYDEGPAKNRSWARLFAETPNYRQLSKEVMGKENFRWHFGPMFYRGRLKANAVKVLVIGQEGAQDESLSHRSFTGGTGARMQNFLNYMGITQSYLFLNTFVYPIFGQYDPKLRWLAQDPESPIVKHRHAIFDYVVKINDVHLVVAVGKAAKESVVTWVEARGGECPQGAKDVTECSGAKLDRLTKIVGVRHPGGAGKGGSVAAIINDFKKALGKVKTWTEENAKWLPPDPDGVRQFDQRYKYSSAEIPFRDFPFGAPMRLGRGGTSSNRKDRQRSIQIFSAGGKYNAKGARLKYEGFAKGSKAGYEGHSIDLPYEPPKKNNKGYDKGPGKTYARLFMGGKPGLEWPDFNALGADHHPSFGAGAIFRGRPSRAKVLVIADQQSHDDLFTGRALSGESGQHMQGFLEALGIDKSYIIIRSLPIDTLALKASEVSKIIADPQVRKVYQAIVTRLTKRKKNMGLVLTFGKHSQALLGGLDSGELPRVNIKSWKDQGGLKDWRDKLKDIKKISYKKDFPNPNFNYDGSRGQIPRLDLPYGTLRWIGSSGDRASRPKNLSTHKLSPDYYKLYLPDWAYRLKPEPLNAKEKKAIQSQL